MSAAERAGHGPRRLLTLLTLLAVIAAAYVAAVGYLYLAQRGYLFVPGGRLADPAELGLSEVQVIPIPAHDGVVLTAWYAEARPGQPTVLYFHGNAGNLSDRAERFQQVLASGFGLLAASYRGYPGSGGRPSQDAFFADGLMLFDWLAQRANEVVLHGESLGTGIAAYVAAERPVRAVVLEAPYTAAMDVAAEIYPWVPVRWLMRDPFVTREHIRRVEEPVLIAQGTEDHVIPVEHGKRLYTFARDPKQLAIFEGGGHSDLWDRGLWARIVDFLAKQPGGATARRL